MRGGGPFDDDPRCQGFGTGLFTDPNGGRSTATPTGNATACCRHDLIKLGLAGSLRGFWFVEQPAPVVTGDEVDYNGQPAGYAAEPDEVINYVDAHDNETLFDALDAQAADATPRWPTGCG